MSLSPQRVDVDKLWGELAHGAHRVLTLTAAKGMPLIENVYKLCTAQPQPHADELYARLRRLLEARVDALAKELEASSGEALLLGYQQRWHTYSLGADYLHHIFRYLNQHWIKKKMDEQSGRGFGTTQVYTPSGPVSNQVGAMPSAVCEVGPLALVVWREHMIACGQTSQRLVAAALEHVQRMRDGLLAIEAAAAPVQALGQCLIKLGSLHRAAPLDLYRKLLEAPYVSAVRGHYSRCAEQWLEAGQPVAAYVRLVEQRLQAEHSLQLRLLDASSAEPVRAELDQVLIAQRETQLLSEADDWLAHDLVDELHRLHGLLHRIGRLQPLADALQTHVARHGVRCLERLPPSDQRDPRRYVDTLLSVSERFSSLVDQAFGGQPVFRAALERGLRQMLNEPHPTTTPTGSGGGGAAAGGSLVVSASKSAELLAKYSDLLLKKPAASSRAASGGLESAAELEAKLAQLVQLFKYLDDKDVFQKFYTKLLARRLIQETSVSDDAERTVLSSLRVQAGYEFVAKLQRMFTDVQLATEINDKFFDWRAQRAIRLPVEQFSVSVLTAGSWPLQTQPAAFQVPPELEVCLSAFSAYYASEHQGRRLSWLHALGKAELRTCYLAKRYELLVSNYQLAVLLAFNQHHRLHHQQHQQQAQTTAEAAEAATVTFEWLQGAAGLAEPDLRRAVVSLLDAKLLLCSPPAASSAAEQMPPGSSSMMLTPMHALSLNTAFTSKRLKLKLLGAMQKEGTGGGGAAGEEGGGGEQQRETRETLRAVDDERKLFVQAAIVRIMKTRKQLSHAALVHELIEHARNRFQLHVPLVKRCIETLIEKVHCN
eukprot:TRINITY_DN4793_c0_g1_i1.p1 TRINITY_DN4793_c0_g1~~TRINITY_DN4793_c0_g1_i1.p1  ORF type:complete len:826 (+),score=399.02 TRINITY_DN4793_c0_g1_i1:355-2832(+)